MARWKRSALRPLRLPTAQTPAAGIARPRLRCRPAGAALLLALMAAVAACGHPEAPSPALGQRPLSSGSSAAVPSAPAVTAVPASSKAAGGGPASASAPTPCASKATLAKDGQTYAAALAQQLAADPEVTGGQGLGTARVGATSAVVVGPSAAGNCGTVSAYLVGSVEVDLVLRLRSAATDALVGSLDLQALDEAMQVAEGSTFANAQAVPAYDPAGDWTVCTKIYGQDHLVCAVSPIVAVHALGGALSGMPTTKVADTVVKGVRMTTYDVFDGKSKAAVVFVGSVPPALAGGFKAAEAALRG